MPYVFARIWNNRKNRYLFAIALLYVITRTVLILLGTGEIYGPGEFFLGNMAEAIIKGPILPVSDYYARVWAGGSIIVPFLIVPFFIVLGKTYLSLKIAAALISLVTLILLYLFLYEFLNLRIAVFASLLFIFSPPMYAKSLLMDSASHAESTLFTLICLVIFYRIFYNANCPVGAHRRAAFILLGIVCGFASWFGYAFSISLIVLLIIWFLLDARFWRKNTFFLFVLSFLLGFSPWFYFNLIKWSSLYGLRIFKNALPQGFFSPSQFAVFVNNLITVPSFLMTSFYFKNLGLFINNLFSFSYLSIFVYSYIWLIWRHRVSILSLVFNCPIFNRAVNCRKDVPPELYFVIYPLIFFLFFCNLDPSFIADNYRFLLPFYPFLFIIIALFLNWLWESNKKKLFSISIFFFLLFICILGDSSLLSLNLFKRMPRYQGLSGFDLAFCIDRKCRKDVQQSIYYAGKMTGTFKVRTIRGIAKAFVGNVENDSDVEEWLGIMNGVNKELRHYFYCAFAQEQMADLFGNNLEEALKFINRVDNDFRFYFYRAVNEILIQKYKGDYKECLEAVDNYKHLYKFNEADLWFRIIASKLPVLGSYSLDKTIKDFVALANAVPLEHGSYIYKELGRIIGYDLLAGLKRGSQRNIDTRRVVNIARMIPLQYKADLYEGVGEGIVSNETEDILLWLDLVEQMEEEYRIAVMRGIGSGLAWIYGGDASSIAEEIEDNVSLLEKKALADGLFSGKQRIGVK